MDGRLVEEIVAFMDEEENVAQEVFIDFCDDSGVKHVALTFDSGEFSFFDNGNNERKLKGKNTSNQRDLQFR